MDQRVDQKDIDKVKNDVAKSLKDKFSNKGDFARQIRKAKRHLPRKSLQSAAVIEQAEANLKHPRLRKLVDKNQVAKAKRNLLIATDKADPAAQRSRFWYSWASGLVINLILALVVIFIAAKWVGAF